ncbi:MAG: ATP-binding cassette domain-containing protein [Micrococcaceae bacterium]
MINLKDVSYTYPGSKKPVFEFLNFKVDKGEFVYLIGPSGSGKSTILKLLLREFAPKKGKVSVLGRDLSTLTSQRIPEYRKEIGVVFQDYKLLEDRNAYENLEFVMRAHGEEAKTVKPKIKKILKSLDMERYEKTIVAKLSGGEKQRLAIARAMILSPKVIVADEPTGNLDLENSIRVMDLFEDISASGVSIIFATHAEYIVNEWQHRVVSIKDAQREPTKQELAEIEAEAKKQVALEQEATKKRPFGRNLLPKPAGKRHKVKDESAAKKNKDKKNKQQQTTDTTKQKITAKDKDLATKTLDIKKSEKETVSEATQAMPNVKGINKDSSAKQDTKALDKSKEPNNTTSKVTDDKAKENKAETPAKSNTATNKQVDTAATVTLPEVKADKTEVKDNTKADSKAKAAPKSEDKKDKEAKKFELPEKYKQKTKDLEANATSGKKFELPDKYKDDKNAEGKDDGSKSFKLPEELKGKKTEAKDAKDRSFTLGEAKERKLAAQDNPDEKRFTIGEDNKPEAIEKEAAEKRFTLPESYKKKPEQKAKFHQEFPENTFSINKGKKKEIIGKPEGLTEKYAHLLKNEDSASKEEKTELSVETKIMDTVETTEKSDYKTKVLEQVTNDDIKTQVLPEVKETEPYSEVKTEVLPIVNDEKIVEDSTKTENNIKSKYSRTIRNRLRIRKNKNRKKQ